MRVIILCVNIQQTNCETYLFKLQKIKNWGINKYQFMKYDMLIANALPDRFLNRNAQFYDMHGIMTTDIVGLASILL